MEVPYMQPLSQRAYASPSSHYEDDDVMSSSSYNVPVSNASGSTVTFEQTASGRSSAPRHRVRDMVKLFEGSTLSNVTTPVHRAESSVFTSSKPYYTGAAHGSTINSFGGSQASVKQYVTQFQEGDEQVKVNEKCRCNAGGARVSLVAKPYAPPYHETEEQAKVAGKCRSCTGTGCEVSAVSGYGASQTSMKPQFMTQFQEGDAPVKITERCPRCNVLYRCDEVHYCLANKKGRTVPRSELDCNNGSTKPGNGLKLSPYSGFAENRNSEMLRSPSKELSQSKLRETRRNPTNLYEKIDGIPVSLAYDSKTTILRTPDGVRIVVDISIDSMSSISAADMICSRIETEMPPSRILAEFQQKSAMIMAGEDNRL